LLAADVPVHYGFIQICVTDADQPGHAEACAGQRNGLCGVAVRDVLALVTGLHTGRVPLVVEWHDAEPPSPEASWEEVVEVPFTVSRRDLTVASFGSFIPVRLPRKGRLRARFCASGMDEAQEVDTITSDLPAIDRYLVQLWPAAQRAAARWPARRDGEAELMSGLERHLSPGNRP